LLEDIELIKLRAFFFVFVLEILMEFSIVAVTYVEMLERFDHIADVLRCDLLFILKAKVHLGGERGHEVPL